MKKYSIIWTIAALLMLSFKLPQTNTGVIREHTIINIYDAFSKDSSLTKDFGFSCITRYNGKNILFDAGSNADIFKSNIQKIGIDLSKIDIVVISHSHFDHLNGLDYVLKVNPQVKIYFPNDIFWGGPVPFDATGQEPGVKDSLPYYLQYFNGERTKFAINQSGRFWNANIEFVKDSKEILPGMHLVATRSQYLGYFSCYPNKSFVEGQFQQQKDECKNTNLPELSLALKTEAGFVLITGCSHTGVENIISQAGKELNENINMVYGGFHLIPFNRKQTEQIVYQLKNELKVNKVAPAHCTGHLAFKILSDTYGKDFLYAGLGSIVAY